MTYRGHVENGMVVFEQPVPWAEGTPVNVEPAGKERSEPPLSEVLLKYAGKAKGLPPDASRNLDHYLYGAPKQ